VLDNHIRSDSEYGDSAKGDSQPRANAQIADGLSRLPVFRAQQGSNRNSDVLNANVNYVQRISAIKARTFPLLYLS
jgi:hypothetical protein